MRINCLEPQIYNKIAAGEVVERPASIVKELVENSVDAGSSIITVSITNGGISEIKVEDNGSGIHYDDLERAFMPHATSKIQTVDDLFGIKTLGFRGEALASIASVSEVHLESKQKEAEYGGMIEISGGQVVSPKSIFGRANGTTMIVSNLFFNVPARQKFLKKPKTEESEITSLMAKFILANPCISFKYVVDGKIKYISSGKGMEEALFVVYGKEAVENSLYIEKDYGYIKIYGYVGKPSFSKPNRTYQTIIINNRVITNVAIMTAVQSAYGEMLMKKQYPFFVLYLDLDYTKLDVNVHPNKMEVRFENSSDIYMKVLEVVNRKLNSLDFTLAVKVQEKEDEPTNNAEQEKQFILPKETPQEVFVGSESSIKIQNNTKPQTKTNEIVTNIGAEDSANKINQETLKEVKYKKINDSLQDDSVKEAEERHNIFTSMAIINNNPEALGSGVSLGSKLLDELQKKREKSRQEELALGNKQAVVVGVLFKTYIIVEQEDTMLLVDQHAGHERLLYDKFMKDVNNESINIQPLFVPYVLSLNSIENEYFEAITPMLFKLGFDIEEFGSNTYRVNSVPYILSDIKLEAFFNEILSDTKSYKNVTISDIMRDKIASKACKAAVKAGDKLSEEEILFLIGKFKENGTQLLCPHGRPVVVKIERKELEKWFKRIV